MTFVQGAADAVNINSALSASSSKARSIPVDKAERRPPESILGLAVPKKSILGLPKTEKVGLYVNDVVQKV